MCVRLMEQLCWDGPFCSTVFAEELKDRSGQRYTIADGKRNFGNEKAFETDIKLPLLHVRLEIAALERTRGEKLKERFVPLPKITKDVGCFGEYVPAKPTFPVKPPSVCLHPYPDVLIGVRKTANYLAESSQEEGRASTQVSGKKTQGVENQWDLG